MYQARKSDRMMHYTVFIYLSALLLFFFETRICTPEKLLLFLSDSYNEGW